MSASLQKVCSLIGYAGLSFYTATSKTARYHWSCLPLGTRAVVAGLPSHGTGQDPLSSPVLWDGSEPVLPLPLSQQHSELISGTRCRGIVKEPFISDGSLLVSTERRDYLADFFFHPANFSPLYNISFQYNPVSLAH